MHQGHREEWLLSLYEMLCPISEDTDALHNIVSFLAGTQSICWWPFHFPIEASGQQGMMPHFASPYTFLAHVNTSLRGVLAVRSPNTHSTFQMTTI